MTTLVDTFNVSEIPITAWLTPPEKARSVTKVLSFPAPSDPYALNLEKIYELGSFTTFQTIYVDNSAVNTPTVISFDQTQQSITVQGGMQGYFPIDAVLGGARMHVSNPSGSGLVTVILINVPISSGTWVGNSANVPSSGGAPGYPQGNTTSGEVGPLMQASVLSAHPTYAVGTTNPLWMDTSGELTVTLSQAGSALSGATGNSVPGRLALYVAGCYTAAPTEMNNATASMLQLDAYGALKTVGESDAPTYSCAFQVTPGAAATDVATIIGSATKTIRIHQIMVGFDATANTEDVAVSIIMRSAANTGGSSITPAIAMHDSNNGAATAVVRAYTANPTGLGASAGTIEQFRSGAYPNSGNPTPPFNYGPAVGDQSLVLRGVAQSVAINLEGAALVTGETVRIKIKWTEI